MFAPKLAKPQTNAAKNPTRKLAPQSSNLAHRLGPDMIGHAPFFQRTVGNQATLRLVEQPSLSPGKNPSNDQEQDGGTAEGMMAREGPRGASWDFSKIPLFPRDQANLRSVEPSGSFIPPIVQEVLQSPGQPLDATSRAFFEPRFGHDFSQVRVHTDRKAAESARAVNALAYTVGHDMVFGHGQFAPCTGAGQRLLAHELAHTVQQRDAVMPSLESLEISSPDDHYEHEAEHVAQSVVQMIGSKSANDSETVNPEEILAANPAHVARLQRVISFTTAPGTFTPNNVGANENAAGFVLTSPVPTFQWIPDVTIHGDATDVFADWETAHHQVGKGFWVNVWWGTGADRTHRQRTIGGGLPMRDATAVGNTWYSDWRAQGFTADGDVRSPVMRDTPSTGNIPWNNPIAGRGGTRGWFNYGFGFVSTLSARHIPDGTGAAAFRHLDHVHWNFSVDGTFDTTLPVPGRVTLNGGAINRSSVIPGIDPANRPMHGGPVINDNFVDTDA